ncbi:MAG: cytochrome P450 [Acidimicrobiia bacterium]
MSAQPTSDVYYDPYDLGINTNPYPIFRRLREEAPLYYNQQYDFYAISRAEDVERALADHTRLSNAQSDILDFIRLGAEWPRGFFIFEDPPLHTAHRGVVSRVFTPRKMAALEPQVRTFCARSLDPLVGRDRFDFVRDFGALISMRVIGMLLGIPESDQLAVHDHVNSSTRNDPGQPLEVDVAQFADNMFAEYIDWRADHPSDDLMTELLNVEFVDETSTTRRLTREEILTFVTLLSGAGNETTAKMIGWIAKVLSDHPDQRRSVVDDPSLSGDAVEEILRYEPPGPQMARLVLEDVEFQGQVVPAGSVLVCVLAAANRDDRRFPDGDRFDVHRKPSGIFTFSFGLHFCLGAALARLQGRVALEEVLKRFPEWTVDDENAQLVASSTTRGYESLPVFVTPPATRPT